MNPLPDVSQAPHIIDKAESLSLNLRVLYEAVIDLSSEGLITANCINMAAGILLNDLGLPAYFFENITKDSLKQILSSITSSISVQENKVALVGRVAHIDFDLEHGNDVQRVRIATRDTRDSMEKLIETLISGHRREYYYSRENDYYTYIIRPETVSDYTKNEFKDSHFLFNLAGDFTATPEPTRMRYEKFLKDCRESVEPFIEAFNLPVTGETRFMFNSDFATPQIPIFRQLFRDHGLTLMRAYWEPYWDGSEVSTSICSLYIQGEISRTKEEEIIQDLQSFLAFSVGEVTDLYVSGQLSYREMLFAGNAIDFTQMFIYTEGENDVNRGIMSRLGCKAYEDAFASRIHKANRATYDARTIRSTAMAHPDLIKALYALFEQRFDPALEAQRAILDLEGELAAFHQMLRARFMDFPLGREIFSFMAKMVTSCLKTNFYCRGKRSYAFRFDNAILDPLVYNQEVLGIF
ncbi:MAG: NADP-specific glutamate dehydrogenase GdhA, partial [Desulfobacterales bacterium]|nr:NADP-specific glutamate dehydrogenase GdhA [Desulfobacterales bacterium]